MLLQTEPKLFHGMLRLRIGLIIQVMAQEVSSCLKIAKDEGINELMRFSPSEMRNLLHHLMAGFEFQITTRGGSSEDIGYRVVIEDKVISKVSDLVVVVAQFCETIRYISRIIWDACVGDRLRYNSREPLKSR